MTGPLISNDRELYVVHELDKAPTRERFVLKLKEQIMAGWEGELESAIEAQDVQRAYTTMNSSIHQVAEAVLMNKNNKGKGQGHNSKELGKMKRSQKAIISAIHAVMEAI